MIMKCFERLVLSHIKANIPADLDSLHFAYCRNKSTEDAVSITLHTSLTHLEHPREDVQHVIRWCGNNDLVLNTAKTKEMVVDYRRAKKTTRPPFHINGEEVEGE